MVHLGPFIEEGEASMETVPRLIFHIEKIEEEALEEQMEGDKPAAEKEVSGGFMADREAVQQKRQAVNKQPVRMQNRLTKWLSPWTKMKRQSPRTKRKWQSPRTKMKRWWRLEVREGNQGQPLPSPE